MNVLYLIDAMTEEQKQELKQEEMRKQLPADDYPVPTIDGPPDASDERSYPLPYDCVLVVPYDKYTESEAREALAKQATHRGVRNVGQQFYTARFWCQRARKSS